MIKNIIIVCSVLFLNSCNKAEVVKIFLIPKGYEGPLIIIEDQKQKAENSINNDTVIFDFRKSKILRLRNIVIGGWNSFSNLKYYYVDDLNKRTLIPFFLNGVISNVDSNNAYIFIKSTQIGGGCPKLGFGGSQCDLISKPKNFQYNFQQQQQIFDSLISCPVDTVKDLNLYLKK